MSNLNKRIDAFVNKRQKKAKAPKRIAVPKQSEKPSALETVAEELTPLGPYSSMADLAHDVKHSQEIASKIRNFGKPKISQNKGVI